MLTLFSFSACKKEIKTIKQAIVNKSIPELKRLIRQGQAINLDHLKFAYSLFAKYYKKYRPKKKLKNDKIKQISKLLIKPYIITKNKKYPQSNKILKSVISRDGLRKAEIYKNGVVKIFNLKSGKFIKAFGNLHYIKRFVFANKDVFFIRRHVNIKVKRIPSFFAKKKEKTYYQVKLRGRGHCEKTELIYINKSKFTSKNFSHCCCSSTVEAEFTFSPSGKYMVYIENCHHRTIKMVTLYDLKEDKRVLLWPDKGLIDKLVKLMDEKVYISWLTNSNVKFHDNEKYVSFDSEITGTIVKKYMDIKNSIYINIKTKHIKKSVNYLNEIRKIQAAKK